MTNRYKQYFDKLTSMFNTCYSTALSGTKKLKKDKLLQFSPIIFRRWYYASLMSDMGLTPANIMVCLNMEYNKPVMTVPLLRYTEKNDCFAFDTVDYGTESHPAVLDAALLLKSCSPIVYIDENGKPDDYSITEQLTINENCYTDFLLSILVRRGLLKLIPSINNTGKSIYQPSAGSFEYFEESHLDILSDFTDTTIDIFIDEVSHYVPLDRNIKKSLTRMLQSPASVDDFFDKLHSVFGMKMEDALLFDSDDIDMDNLSEMQHIIMAGAFFIGIELDKRLFTPFSYYFQLIRPIYANSFALNDEIKLLSTSPADSEDNDVILYAPCMFYSITELGRALTAYQSQSGNCEIPPTTREQTNTTDKKKELQKRLAAELGPYWRFFDKTEKIPRVKSLLEVADYFSQAGGMFGVKTDEPTPKNEPVTVYQIKVKLERNKNCWATVQFTEKSTISDMHNFICFTYNLDPYCDYSFYASETENPFTEIGNRPKPVIRRKSGNVIGKEKDNKDSNSDYADSISNTSKSSDKENATKLGSLNVTDKQKLLYILHNPSESLLNRQKNMPLRFELEVEKIFRHSRDFGDFYPKMTKASKLFYNMITL